MDTKLKIIICGGGNGAHCLSVFASQRKNIEVSVLTLHDGSAERWNSSLKEGCLTMSATQPDGSVKNIESSPSFVTNDAAAAMDQIQVVFIVAPAYRHELYIRTILPYIKPNMLVVGLPGHAGFELQCKYVLGNKSRICTIVGFDSLPWGCRVVDYGKHVRLFGKKDVVYATMLTGIDFTLPFQVIETLQYILGEKPVIKLASNFLSVSLMAGSILHPPLMYGKWKDWDGQPLPEVPSYFKSVNEEQADIMSNLSDELVATAKRISDMKRDMDMSDVIHIHDWFKQRYYKQISDDSSVMTCMRTNQSYSQFVHPMNAVENGYVPDFEYRYMTEDIPFGLVVMKGIAEIVSVETPTMDKIIKWAQSKIGKEYLVGGSLKGKHLKEVRAPQSYEIRSLDELLNFIYSDMRPED
ncbi:opine dehydrogenase-like [Mytilus californianus]|uniref:opine dehydrogenase-like n=1 Tax=Mytilus californianus TaxID=6549 RepID=UPI002245FD64|nr:opine dehydrogenase-like [Mytilus californianus]